MALATMTVARGMMTVDKEMMIVEELLMTVAAGPGVMTGGAAPARRALSWGAWERAAQKILSSSAT